MPLQKPHTRIPSQHRVVITGGTQRFGLFEAGHRLGDPIVDAGAVARELRFGAALGDEAAELGAVVLAGQAGDNLTRAREGVRLFDELVR